MILNLRRASSRRSLLTLCLPVDHPSHWSWQFWCWHWHGRGGSHDLTCNVTTVGEPVAPLQGTGGGRGVHAGRTLLPQARAGGLARLVCRSDRPFDGIQLVLCGDFLQLPPISRKEEPALVFCFQVLPKLSVAGLTTSATCRLTHRRNEREAFHVTCLTSGCPSCAWLS
ncbi:uncharacterized protein LOC142560054 isoform X2 [Dermacentor variabilis]|uniref:uncharacterized protein LOC142560054 isoform X2 n=1 Tax=Dermacentor variabilis TaxID=34621 RepID=UPI003F5AF50A